MLNVLSDVATVGDTILAVWVWGPSKIGNLFSNVIGSVGPPGDSATATSMVESAVNGATGLDGAEAATAFNGPSAVYIGMTMTVNQDGDGVPYNNLFSPLANLGGFFTNGAGPILSFVDYGNAGESSGPLAQLAASKDDTGFNSKTLAPLSAINGIQDGIDALGPETPYFQGVWGVGTGGVAVGASGGAAFVRSASGGTGATGGFSAETQQQTSVNATVGAAAGTAQKVAQTVKDTATGASIGIVGILIALIVAEVFLTKGSSK